LPDEAIEPFDKRPRAVVLGCAGERLTPDEARFFTAADPLGFVIFGRNCRNRDQLRDLVGELRAAVGRADAPVLIDQEGGRVARLKPPEWRAYPAAGQLARLPDPLAFEAARLSARLIADDLSGVGITVDCAPVLDLPIRDADPVIGDRAWADGESGGAASAISSISDNTPLQCRARSQPASSARRVRSASEPSSAPIDTSSEISTPPNLISPRITASMTLREKVAGAASSIAV
jgi:hypothetical protein